jgi:hypothetical protein
MRQISSGGNHCAAVTDLRLQQVEDAEA